MTARSFTTAFAIDATSEHVYAVINDVRASWSGELDCSDAWNQYSNGSLRQLIARAAS